ncbi:MAG: hypothetical protein FJ139_11725 [Deltaproteobacteria bacterium]|nr:hypothetical protein [Deltaproteobacteria bacterium]
MADHTKSEHLTGGTSSTRLRVRTGNLRASTKPMTPIIKEDSIEGGIQFGTVYAGTHIGPRGKITEIKPTKGKDYLTIPFVGLQMKKNIQGPFLFTPSMTKAGVLKGSARSGMWGETFVRKSKKGNLILFGKQIIQRGIKAGLTKGRIVPLFILKKSVKIPARVHPEDIIDWTEPRLIGDMKKIGATIAGEVRNV